MRKLFDITGRRFGRLVAVREVERKGKERCWLCRCDCGNEKVVMMMNLRSGATQSCGCLHKEIKTADITGQRFDALVALKIVGKEGRFNLWLCQCDCGKTRKVAINNLQNGKTRSCGCLNRKLGASKMQKDKIKKYIDSTLLTKQEAMRITGQNIKGFDQTVASGNLKPFFDHGEGRSRVRLYHRDDVEAYARQAEKRRRETYKEIWTVVIDSHKRPVYSEDEARKMAEKAAAESDKVYIEYYRAEDGQEAFLNPNGYGFESVNWADS